MPYLAPHFDYDVFMSYAHGQVQGYPDAPLRDWSQRFIDQLRADFGALRNDFDALEFWDDRKVDPTAAMTVAIKDAVERSGILLIMMSPKYLASQWCISKELDWFKTQFQSRRQSPGRVFVVRAVSTNTDGWPDFLKDESGHPDIGFRFHPETTQEGTEPYCYPHLQFRTEDFNRPFSMLRTTLIGRLQEIKKICDGAYVAPLGNSAPSRPPSLYFHAPAGSGKDQIARDLRADGFRIVPAIPPASGNDIADYQAEVTARVQAAERCDALALLRATDDPMFEDEFLEIGADELARINASRPDRPLQCAVLDAAKSPFKLADYALRSGVKLFDLNDPAWRPTFKAWIVGAMA
jgi:TIR domain